DPRGGRDAHRIDRGRQRRGPPAGEPAARPWRAHLLAAATYTVATSGIVGILPESLTILGLGLGVLLLLLAVLIAWRAQVRHRGRVGSAPVVGAPRSVLSAWLAGGPALFYLTLPEGLPVAAAVLLSLLLGTVFHAVLRLEDGELTAQGSRPNAPR